MQYLYCSFGWFYSCFFKKSPYRLPQWLCQFTPPSAEGSLFSTPSLAFIVCRYVNDGPSVGFGGTFSSIWCEFWEDALCFSTGCFLVGPQEEPVGGTVQVGNPRIRNILGTQWKESFQRPIHLTLEPWRSSVNLVVSNNHSNREILGRADPQRYSSISKMFSKE